MSPLEMAQEPRLAWVLVRPAPDVAGQWLAHCLELDVVTQGDSLEHAFQMAREAVEIIVLADASEGLDPFDREPAPDEDWEPLWRIMKHSIKLSSVPKEKWNRVRCAAAQLEIRVPTVAKSADHLDLPMPWMIAPAFNSERDSGSWSPIPC